jgi:predicted dehydrogenase
VVGLGPQGRALLRGLAQLPGVTVRLVCDHYAKLHDRAKEHAPAADAVTDHRRVLENREVQAVFVATPTHQHADIVIEALQAGKHVYCEAPIAHTLEEARRIGKAALAHGKQVFACGLERRSNPLEVHVRRFMNTGVLGETTTARAQHGVRTSWRRAAASPDRQRELEWRLDPALSPGVLGELGIHQLDVVSWLLRAHPTAVSGRGSVAGWRDGRQVADTVQCVLEFPNDVHLTYSATLTSSFDGVAEFYTGTQGTVLMRADRSWLFKESDAPNLGWEVYATKERMFGNTGITLVANATKLLDEKKSPAKHRDAYSKGSLHYACENFLQCVRTGQKPSAGAHAGFRATVLSLKANEAVTRRARVVLGKELFEL